MMKQTAIYTVFKKIVIVLGFCIIPSASPVFAQNDQATTLLEVQALRQEVAELRDMVERQQYEMRQLQSNIADSKPSPANTASNIVSGNAPRATLNNGATANTATNRVASPNSSTQLSTNSTVQSPGLNYQSGTGRLSVPSQGQTALQQGQTTRNSVNGVVNQANTSLNNTRQLNGGIDASNIPTAPSVLNQQQVPQRGALNGSQVLNQSVPSTSSAGVGNTVNNATRQTAGAFSNSTTGSSVNSAQSNLPSTGGIIRPVETIGSSQSGPSSLLPSTNSGQVQRGASNQVANLNVISENDYYQQGFGLLRDSKHSEAVSVFQNQIKQYPQGELADDAYYWVAESLYVTRKLNASKDSFRAIIQGYPKSDRVPDAMLKLAYIEQEQGNILEARILLQEIIQFHPQSDAALSAKNKLSQIN